MKILLSTLLSILLLTQFTIIPVWADSDDEIIEAILEQGALEAEARLLLVTVIHQDEKIKDLKSNLVNMSLLFENIDQVKEDISETNTNISETNTNISETNTNITQMNLFYADELQRIMKLTISNEKMTLKLDLLMNESIMINHQLENTIETYNNMITEYQSNLVILENELAVLENEMSELENIDDDIVDAENEISEMVNRYLVIISEMMQDNSILSKAEINTTEMLTRVTVALIQVHIKEDETRIEEIESISDPTANDMQLLQNANRLRNNFLDDLENIESVVAGLNLDDEILDLKTNSFNAVNEEVNNLAYTLPVLFPTELMVYDAIALFEDDIRIQELHLLTDNQSIEIYDLNNLIQQQNNIILEQQDTIDSFLELAEIFSKMINEVKAE